MPIVNIDLTSKLGKEQKAQLVAGITRTVVEVTQAPEQAVTIIIREIELDNIAKAGVLFSNRG